VNWLPEELNWSGCRDATIDISEEHCGVLPHIYGALSFPQTPFIFAETCLQLIEEQRWLTGRGYDGCVVRLEGQLDLPGKRRHFVHIHTE
jgi:hypothetical protein